MSKETKNLIYYYLHREWYNQLTQYCDNLSKNGGNKDPSISFWRAVAVGLSGKPKGINEALNQLENLRSKRNDLVYPISIAMKYFTEAILSSGNIGPSSGVNRESLDLLTSEITAAEDIAKDSALVLAARFSLYSKDFSFAKQICHKLYDINTFNSNSVFEIEGMSVEHWCILYEIIRDQSGKLTGSVARKRFSTLDSLVKSKGSEYLDIDLLVLHAKSLEYANLQVGEALNAWNSVIASHQWFVHSLAEKSLLLANIGEWDQALDTAHRTLDVDGEHIDALTVITVHAFTQESSENDNLEKLEELSKSISNRETYSVKLGISITSLIVKVCYRHPRALQLCLHILEKLQSFCINPIDESTLLTNIGNIYLLQNNSNVSSSNILKLFKDAIKKDPNNFQAIESMIKGHIVLGNYEDAEGQIELLSVMNHQNEKSNEILLFKAILYRLTNARKSLNNKDILNLLNDCKNQWLDSIQVNYNHVPFESFRKLRCFHPDFALQLAVEYINQLNGNTNIPFVSKVQKSNENEDSTDNSAVTQSTVFLSTTAATTTLMTMQGPSMMSNIRESKSNNYNTVENDNEYNDLSPALSSAEDILERLLHVCVGHIEPYVELTRCYIYKGAYEEACKILRQSLNLQPRSTSILLTLCKVELYRNNTQTSKRILEQALSSDFSIRSMILFRLLQVYTWSQLGQYDEALTEIEKLMKLPEFTRSDGINNNTNTYVYDSMRLTEDEIVGSYILFSYLLTKNKRLKEAKQVLAEAKVAFAGTPQEVQVLLASSQLAVERKDYDSAVRMLDKISETSSAYTKAIIMKADILLTHHRDKEGYTNCYKQLVEQDKSAKNYAALGEAYLRILNPELAVDSLEVAYKLDPVGNGRLRSRIGRALVATHEYHRAIEFYEQAIRDVTKYNGSINESITLSHDLAKLYKRLSRYESASRVLNSILHGQHKDISELRDDVITLILLSEIEKLNSKSTKNGATNDFFNTLNKAKNIQIQLVNSLRSNNNTTSAEIVDNERVRLSDICYQVAEAGLFLNDMRVAVDGFDEAIYYDPTNTKALIGKARLHLQNGQTDACITECQKILHIDPSHGDAAILLSESLFSQETTKKDNMDVNSAIKPLQEVLVNQPTNFQAIEKMILLLRRCGRLHEASTYLTTAESTDRRVIDQAGYHYCQGLYSRYTNDIGKAIVEFNLARKDEKFGEDSLIHMIELYLNPDQEGVWEERDDPQASGVDEQTAANLNCAETLLKELESKSKNNLKYKVLENNYLLATKQKPLIAKAMASFGSILEKDSEYLPAVLGMATGFMIEKNAHKARNLLKRVATMDIKNDNDGEDYEKANLLLAKFHIDKNKNDLAEELCHRCLLHNKSSSSAWEILGLIYEKQQDYEKASECYEKAWKLEFEASAPIGFKLAFSYLKSKKLIESIDICEIVLAQYPDYPRIREEILKKAQLSIRTK